MTRTTRQRAAVAVAAGVVAAAGVWLWWLASELASPLSFSGHHDFFALYSAATLVKNHQPALLYDAAAMTSLERQIFPHPTGYAGYLPYLNPPSAAVILSPLSRLGFADARVLWLGVSLLLGIACVVLLCRGNATPVWLLGVLAMFGTFPAYQTLIEGQWTYVMLLGALGALQLARSHRDVPAGALLAVLWLKPPLLLLVLMWLILTRRWRIAAAAVGAVLALTVITLPWTGIGANVNYLQYLVNVSAAHAAGGGAAGATAWEGAFINMEGLLGVAAAIMGQVHPLAVDVLTALLSLAVIALVAYGLRRNWSTGPRPVSLGVAALCAGLLLDPHLYAQDCLLLLVPVAALLRHTTQRLPLMLAACVVMDLAAIDTLSSQGLFPLPLHLFTGVLLAALVLLIFADSSRVQSISRRWLLKTGLGNAHDQAMAAAPAVKARAAR